MTRETSDGAAEITVYGPRPDGGRNLGVRVGAVAVLLTPDDESAQVEAERLAVRLLANAVEDNESAEHVAQLESEVETLRASLVSARASTAAAEARAIAATGGRRRFFGPVLLVPAKPGDWTGEVWLQDPEKREHGRALRFASLAEVRTQHPELWVIGTTTDGVLLDAWGGAS